MDIILQGRFLELVAENITSYYPCINNNQLKCMFILYAYKGEQEQLHCLKNMLYLV